MTDVVADTMVWYGLSDGTLNLRELKAHHLLATPTSILELITKVTEETFLKRRAAASALQSSCARVLPDAEAHLAALWRIPGKNSWTPILRDRLRAFCECKSYEEATGGPALIAATTAGPVDLSVNTKWREDHAANFAAEFECAIDSRLPNYLRRRSEGQMKQRNAAERKQHEWEFATDAFRGEILRGTRARVLLSLREELPPPSSEQEVAARKGLEPYLRVYQQYVLAAGTSFAPQPNDFNDLEHFLYLQDGRKLLTLEQRFVDLATRAGIRGHLIER